MMAHRRYQDNRTLQPRVEGNNWLQARRHLILASIAARPARYPGREAAIEVGEILRSRWTQCT